MPKHALMYTDGGARGNPGPAGIGVVILLAGKKYTYKKYLGIKTNNQAEYEALLCGLSEAKRLGAKNVEVFMDSELIVNQMKQKYKVKNKDLAKLFVKAWNASLAFQKVTFRHHKRSQNKEADRLVNLAIDAAIEK